VRVFVTGSGGFIGGHLCAALEATARDHLRAASIQGADAVVHLANIAHARVPEAELQRVNVEGTLARAREAASAGVRRFVYISSSLAVVGGDPYGRSKLAAEQALSGLRDIEVVILRPPLVYGPRVKANFLALMRAIARGIPLPLASIDNRRSVVYVGNLVDAILHCLDKPEAAGRNLGVTDGTPVSVPELCRRIGEALGRPARLFACPPALLGALPPLRSLTRSLVVEDAALRAGLDWRPPHTMEEGLRETARWYRGL
jgi:UDP-N-acetyl-alpha-D-quinovosamine dehydrogenase